MKILLSGLLVFICWAAFSTYFYVCKIRDLCNVQETIQVTSMTKNDSLAAGYLSETVAIQPDVIPENLQIYFAFDKSSFADDSSYSVYYDEAMAYLLRNSDAGMHITGHTDAIGSDEYNMALGFRRAQSVKGYFESRGLPADQVTIDSKGENEPVDNNATDEGRAKNRRAFVTIIN